jgi:hypothetical protein
MIRAKTFSSSHIEPWLIHVEEYVLLDAEGSVEMYRAAEMGVGVPDSRGKKCFGCVAASHDMPKGDEIAKLCHGYVFTRGRHISTCHSSIPR